MSGKNAAQEILFESIRAGDLAGVEAALDRGADPNGVSRRSPPYFADDVPALLLACWVGHRPIVRCLLDRGADIQACGTNWATYAFNDDPTAFTGPGALYVAASQGHLEVIGILLERGADQPAGSDAPLIGAARAGQLAAARVLIDAGLAVNGRDGDFHTALYYAVVGGQAPLVELIFDAGGRFCRDVDLDEALTRAREADHADVLALLEGRRRRDLLGHARSIWTLCGLTEEMDDLLGLLLQALHGQRPAPGQVLDEHVRCLPDPARPERIHRHRRRRLGPWEESRDEIELRQPGAAMDAPATARELRLAVRGGLFLELSTPDAALPARERRYELQLGGDGPTLDRLDGLLSQAIPPRNLKRVGDRAPAF